MKDSDPKRWGVNESGSTVHYFPDRGEKWRPPGTKPQASCGNAWSDSDPPTMAAVPVCRSCLRIRGGGPPDGG